MSVISQGQANSSRVQIQYVLCHFAGTFGCVLTDTDSDEEGSVREHLPQYIPEVPLTAAVAVLHQLCAPQNCTTKYSILTRHQYTKSMRRNKTSQDAIGFA